MKLQRFRDNAIRLRDKLCLNRYFILAISLIETEYKHFSLTVKYVCQNVSLCLCTENLLPLQNKKTNKNCKYEESSCERLSDSVGDDTISVNDPETDDVLGPSQVWHELRCAKIRTDLRLARQSPAR